MLTLIGASPAAAAASMPSSTRATGKSTSFMALNVSSSSASRLTVTRFKPALRRATALRASDEPLVVRVRSSPGIAASIATSCFDIAPYQRLAARKPHLFDAEAAKYACKPRDLFERQQRLALEELVVLAEHFLRHAVDAAEIAAVGDGDAQVAQGTPGGVAQNAFRKAVRGWESSSENRHESPIISAAEVPAQGNHHFQIRCLRALPGFQNERRNASFAGTACPRRAARSALTLVDIDENAHGGRNVTFAGTPLLRSPRSFCSKPRTLGREC